MLIHFLVQRPLRNPFATSERSSEAQRMWRPGDNSDDDDDNSDDNDNHDDDNDDQVQEVGRERRWETLV